MAARVDAMGSPRYARLTRRCGRRQDGTGNITLDWESLAAPLRWSRPRRIFVNSMADLFHEGVPDDFIAAVWNTMRSAQHHTFQILTKRPERMRRVLAEVAG